MHPEPDGCQAVRETSQEKWNDFSKEDHTNIETLSHWACEERYHANVKDTPFGRIKKISRWI